MNQKSQQSLIIGLTALFLALACISLGYAFVAFIPGVTQGVANASVEADGSPFSKSELVDGAVATREYCFGSHDADAFYATISKMNSEAATPYADASIDELKDAPDRYTVDFAALTHLDEVYDVARNSLFPILGITCIAAFLMMAGLRMFGERVLARSLFWGGAVVLIIIAALGIWAMLSFDSLFTVFHSLLFPNGGWTFPADSLLITMLPEPFWTMMAIVWLAAAAIVGALCLAIGIYFTRRVERLESRARSAAQPTSTE